MLGITVQIYELIDKLPFVFQKKCHLTPKSLSFNSLIAFNDGLNEVGPLVNFNV